MANCDACDGTNTAFFAVIISFGALVLYFLAKMCREHYDGPSAPVVVPAKDSDGGGAEDGRGGASGSSRGGKPAPDSKTSSGGTKALSSKKSSSGHLLKRSHSTELTPMNVVRGINEKGRKAADLAYGAGRAALGAGAKLLVKEDSVRVVKEDLENVKMTGDVNADLKVEVYSAQLHRLLGTATVCNDELLHTTGQQQDLPLVATGGGEYGRLGLQVEAARSLATDLMSVNGTNEAFYSKKSTGTYALISYKKDENHAFIELKRSSTVDGMNPEWNGEEPAAATLPHASNMQATTLVITIWCADPEGDKCVGEAWIDAFSIMDSMRTSHGKSEGKNGAEGRPIEYHLSKSPKYNQESDEVTGSVKVRFSMSTLLQLTVNTVRRAAEAEEPHTPYAIFYMGEQRVLTTGNSVVDEEDKSLAKWLEHNFKIRLTGEMDEKVLMVMLAVGKLKRRLSVAHQKEQEPDSVSVSSVAAVRADSPTQGSLSPMRPPGGKLPPLSATSSKAGAETGAAS